MPAGSLTTAVTGVTLTTTPTLPAGSLTAAQAVTGVVLVTTPSLPQGSLRINTNLQGFVLLTTPQMPAGVVSTFVEPPLIDPNTWARFNNPTGTVVVNRTKFGVGARFRRG